MTTAWAINIIGLFLVTVGALLMFLHFRNAPTFATQLSDDDARRAYEKHRRQSVIAMGLIAAWMVLQYVGLIL